MACGRIQAPLVGPPLSAAALAGPGLVPAERHVRSWVGSRFGLEGEYLLHMGEMLRAHWAWRSFLLEQRALIAQLPAREARRAPHGGGAGFTRLVGFERVSALERLLQLPGASVDEHSSQHVDQRTADHHPQHPP